MDNNPLALLFDAYAVFSEHHDEKPEVYALNPADHAPAVKPFGLAPDPRGGHSRARGRLGRIGPRSVSDASVAPGEVEVRGAAKCRERGSFSDPGQRQ